jgi:cyanophycinase
VVTRAEKKRPVRRSTRKPGPLIVIGGHEDKTGDCVILEALASRLGRGPLLLATMASTLPHEQLAEYRSAFHRLGVKNVVELAIGDREDALDGSAEERAALLARAAGVFFTGGSQIRITTAIGGTPIFEAVRALHRRGGVIAGTSAGASVMSATMLVYAASDTSLRVSDALRMAPGLGLLPHVIVDQHFAQRGRIGRLAAAVAQNPELLGVGIDEDTAIVLDTARELRVIGRGAVYVVDGSQVVRTNLADEETDCCVSVHGARLDILSSGDRYDLLLRRAR